MQKVGSTAGLSAVVPNATTRIVTMRGLPSLQVSSKAVIRRKWCNTTQVGSSPTAARVRTFEWYGYLYNLRVRGQLTQYIGLDESLADALLKGYN